MSAKSHGRAESTSKIDEMMILDTDQSILGYVSPHGFIYDEHRTLLGYVSTQGVVRDVGLATVGSIDLTKHSFPFPAGRLGFFLLKRRQEQGHARESSTREEKPNRGAEPG